MSKKDRFEISRRKALAGIGGIGVASAGAGVGTSAYFSDEESFENNTLTAGELDLKVDWQQTYNGPNPLSENGGVEEHPVNAYPDSNNDGIQDLEGVKYSGAGDKEPVFNAADIPACCNCDENGEGDYYVTYGEETYCIDALGGDESTEDFYEYNSGEWSSLNKDVQRQDTAVLFLYEDDAGELHLFIIHNKLDNSRSSTDGSVASVTVEGAEGCEWLNAGWVEQDEPGTDIDEYQDANGSNVATADWAWQNRKTDGGVLGTLDAEFALRITPALNDAATYDGDDVFQNQTDVERLVLLDGDESTEVVLEDDIGTDGVVDSIVLHSTCGIDSGTELDTPAVFRSEYYPEQEHLVELDDVKPGDRGEITFSLHLCDNPGYIWLMAGNYSQEGGVLTEPERAAINATNGTITDVANVTDSDDTGMLADHTMVRIWYDEDCDNEFDDGGDSGDGEQLIFGPGIGGYTELGGSNPATLAAAMELILDGDDSGRIPLDGQAPRMGWNAGENASDRECLPGETGMCVGVEWWVPTQVGNIIQGDSVSFDLGFYTEQCRHNDGSGPNSSGS